MNKIYYKSSEVMAEVNTRSVDLVVTHPPFLDISNHDYQIIIENVFHECYRVMKDDSVMVLVNTDVKKMNFFAKHILLNHVASDCGFFLRDEKIWVRTENNAFHRMGFSFIQIFSKGDYKRKTISKDFEAGIWNLPYSMNIDTFKDAFHPGIPKRCIEVFTNEGDMVLDPFVGSGTTCIVSEQLKRNSIGYELDSSLKAIIDKRLSEKSLF
jgi:site-specific DNA-methyltransferase (adenine-specific)